MLHSRSQSNPANLKLCSKIGHQRFAMAHSQRYAMNIQNDVIGLVLRENCKSKQMTDIIA